MSKTEKNNAPAVDMAKKEAFASRTAIESKKDKLKETATPELRVQWTARFGQEQVDKWKAQYNNREIIALGVEGKFAALRPPLAEDISDYLMAIGENGLNKAVAMIIETLWLDGDLELINEEDYYIAVFLQMNNILEGKKAAFFRC